MAAVAFGRSPGFVPASGDPSGVTDAAAINEIIANGGRAVLAQAQLATPYFINSPLLPATGAALWGSQWWSASNQDFYSAGSGQSGGSVIVMVPGSGFTAGTAAVQMVNTTGTQNFGVDLAGFTIEGFEVAGGSGVYGILVDGAWGACFMRGVCVHRPDADCLHFTFDTTSGKIPDDWLVSECKFSASRSGNGVFAAFLDDSWFVNCESSEHALDAWQIGFGTNTRLAACKGENSGGAGFHLTGMGAGETQELIGCSTNLNNKDGFLFDNSAGGGGQGTYYLTGCRASNDGQNGPLAGVPTYAGFRDNGSLARIAVTGGGCVPNGTGPSYGAAYTGGSFAMSLAGFDPAGVTAPLLDDGTNTSPLVSALVAFKSSFGSAVAPAIVPLTDAPTITVNAAKGNDFRVTLGGNRTFGAPSNPTDGQVIEFLISQPTSGGPFTATWASGAGGYSFGSGSAPTLSAAAGKSDLVGFKYVAAKSAWAFLGSALGY